MQIIKHECRMNRKSMLIWAISIGAFCFLCLLLYQGLRESMEEMSDAFANMGAFATALGMDRVSLATLEGYYAIEIAVILSLGSGMYAAMAGAGMVAKEEEYHTSEFIHTLPVGRVNLLLQKFMAMLLDLAVFNIIYIAFILFGFLFMEGEITWHYFLSYHLVIFLMQVELATISFLFSSLSRKRPIGVSIGLVDRKSVV